MVPQEASFVVEKNGARVKKSRPNGGSRPAKFRFPRIGTKASRDFFGAWSTINSFFHWVLFMASHMDEMTKRVHELLYDAQRDEGKRKQMQQKWEMRKGMVDELRRNRQFFIEVILVRHIENYLQYLSSLLFEIFTQRPETLRSSEKVEVAFVLSYPSIEDLVQGYAEKKVESLSYSSFEDLSVFFNDRFGLELFPKQKVETVVEAIEIRNISVHARCVISRRYVARTGTDASLIGTTKELYISHLDNLVPLLAESVKVLDKEARAKLKLKGVRFN
jgi:hypothetical protein